MGMTYMHTAYEAWTVTNTNYTQYTWQIDKPTAAGERVFILYKFKANVNITRLDVVVWNTDVIDEQPTKVGDGIVIFSEEFKKTKSRAGTIITSMPAAISGCFDEGERLTGSIFAFVLTDVDGYKITCQRDADGNYGMVSLIQRQAPIISDIQIQDANEKCFPRYGVYVQGESRLTFGFSVTTDENDPSCVVKSRVLCIRKNNVVIASYKLTDNSIDNVVITESGDMLFDITVIDSKGLITSHMRTFNVTPYERPVIENFNPQRYAITEGGSPYHSNDGEYLWSEIRAHISKITGNGKSNSLKARWDISRTNQESGEGPWIPNVLSMGSTSTTLNTSFESSIWYYTEHTLEKPYKLLTNGAYTIVLTVSDSLGNSDSKEAYIYRSTSYVNIEKTGVAVGKMNAEGTIYDKTFEVGYPALFFGDVVQRIGEHSASLSHVYRMDEELPTGDVWFDGRMIFRRFLALPAKTGSTVTIQLTPAYTSWGTNVQLVNLRGMVYTSSGYTGNAYPLPYAHYTAAHEMALYAESNYITLYVYGTTKKWASGWVMVEYARDDDARPAVLALPGEPDPDTYIITYEDEEEVPIE